MLSGGKARSHAIQGIGAGFIPPLFRFERVDRIVAVTDQDAFDWTQRLAREEGVLAGISSGATVRAALDLAAEARMAGQLIVAMACDSAECYVTSTRFERRPTRRERP